MAIREQTATLLKPLFDLYPAEWAMSQLVVRRTAPDDVVEVVQGLLDIAGDKLSPPMHAALWLYVDDLDRSHRISQSIKGTTGSYWHGIMHRREGDFPNSHYWFNKVGAHPAMSQLREYDAHDFIDAVERNVGQQDPKLVALQKAEWSNLFAWCATEEH